MQRIVLCLALVALVGACDDEEGPESGACISPQSSASYVERPGRIGNGRPTPVRTGCGETASNGPPVVGADCESLCTKLEGCGFEIPDCVSTCSGFQDRCPQLFACFIDASCEEISSGRCDQLAVECG